MKYLVTGCAGFIGSCVAKRLLENGNEVVGIDNLTTGFIENVPSGVDFYQFGVEKKDIISILKRYEFDAIFHIAGQSGGELSYADPVYDLQANAQSTLNLLKYASETNKPKIIYASTVSVYGEPNNPILIDEETRLLPKSFYGVGKIASENYLRIYSEQFGLDTSALRLFNTYGPGQNLENLKQGIASIYLAQALKNKHIHIRGDKDRFRDLIYIDDVVDAFIAMLDDDFKGFNYFNVCTGKKTIVKDLVNEIIKNLPFEVTYHYEGSTPGDVFGYTGNPAKLINTGKWKPKVELKDGIKRMVEWALGN